MPRVLITGCSRGLGRGLVDHFLSAGWSVYGCSRSLPDVTSPSFTHYQIDLTHSDQLMGMIQMLRRSLSSRGRWPAVDPIHSLSRPSGQDSARRAPATALREVWAQLQEQAPAFSLGLADASADTPASRLWRQQHAFERWLFGPCTDLETMLEQASEWVERLTGVGR